MCETVVRMLVPRPLAGRYAFTKRIRGTQRTIIWLARDQRTGGRVVASILPAPRAAALEPALDLSHVHAASILRVIDSPARDEVPGDEAIDTDARVVVAEYIEGRSLQQRIDAGPVSTETAVEWIASVADALALFHARGAVHGAVSPRALIVVRSEPAIVPILTHLIVPPSGAYCSPERVTGGGPSETDDAWALAATLYSALSRRAPFRGASRTELAQAIVAASPAPLRDVDARLWDIVARGLAAEPTMRLSTVAGLRDALRDWMDQTGALSLGDFAPVAALVGASEPPPNVGDLSLVAALAQPESAEAMAPFRVDTVVPEDHDAEVDDPKRPPTDPPRRASVPLPLPKTRSKPPAAAKTRTWLIAVVSLAVVATVATAVGIVTGKMRGAGTEDSVAGADRGEAPSAPENAAAAAPATAIPLHAPTPPLAAVSAAMDLSREAPTAASSPPITSNPPADVTSCARSLLPPGTLGSGADVDLGYLCKEGELWGMTRKLDLTVAKHGEAPGMVLWAHLGRYDLAAVAVLLTRCCPANTAFKAANPRGVCESLPSAVEEVSRNQSAENIDRYAESVDCFISRGVRYPEEWWDRVGPKDARGYFEEYLRGLRKP